jgi:pyridoxal phosphate enzyme (YggS family)
MTDIKANIESIRSQIPDHMKLVAVSKTRPVQDILLAYNAGQKIFGENRVQEILDKKDHLPSDVEWHMIGHLQTNKVRQIVQFIRMIQSVDSVRLLSVINSEAEKTKRIVDCLLEVHIAREESKSGFSREELDSAFQAGAIMNLKNVRVCGVMGMATFTSDIQQVRSEFRYLRGIFEMIKVKYFTNDPSFSEISMGMSGDYFIAIEEGSTMIRIGSLIFGERTRKPATNG